MRKIKTFALLLMILLTVTASTTIVSAARINKIKFNASASGPCAVIYGLGTRGADPIPDQEIWYWGDGMGTTRINGTAKKLKPADIIEPVWGEGYESTKIKAVGSISVSWTNTVEEIDEENLLVAVIYSTASTYGFFKLNELFSMPIPGIAPTPEYQEMLGFKGIHVIGSEIKIIQGFALYMTAPLTSFGLPGTGYLYNVGLGIPLEGDNLIIYQLMWCSGDMPGCPPGGVIEWNVEQG